MFCDSGLARERERERERERLSDQDNYGERGSDEERCTQLRDKSIKPNKTDQKYAQHQVSFDDQLAVLLPHLI